MRFDFACKYFDKLTRIIFRDNLWLEDDLDSPKSDFPSIKVCEVEDVVHAAERARDHWRLTTDQPFQILPVFSALSPTSLGSIYATRLAIS
jgi:hypothetical protein